MFMADLLVADQRTGWSEVGREVIDMPALWFPAPAVASDSRPDTSGAKRTADVQVVTFIEAGQPFCPDTDIPWLIGGADEQIGTWFRLQHSVISVR